MKILFIFFLATACVFGGKLDEKFSWKQLDFSWPSDDVKQEAIRSKRYIEKNNLPSNLDIWKDKMFITVPRLASGIPSSLNYIKLTDGKTPILHPYPSWDVHKLPVESNPARVNSSDAERENILEKNNSTIISTSGIRVDECDRLWVLDCGITDIIETPKYWAPITIAVFDLNTDKLIRRFSIPSNQIRRRSFMANIVVDTQSSSCDEAFAYVIDSLAAAVIVYDYKSNKSYRVKHHYFNPDPLEGDFTVDGINFQWNDGIFAMTLGKPVNKNGDRTVYFTALGSTNQFSVSNTVLKNESFANSNTSYHAFSFLGDRGEDSQSTAEFFDAKTNAIFYTLISQNAVGCWNINKPFTPETQAIVDKDSERLIFPNDLKIDADGNLYVLSNRVSTFLYGVLKPEVNYRVLTGKTSDLVSGTTCAMH